MCSYANLYIGELTLYWTKDLDNPTVMMLFTSEDLRIKKSRKSEDDEEPHPQVSYRTKLNVLRDRLEFMGFTLKKVIKEFEESVKERLSELIVLWIV